MTAKLLVVLLITAVLSAAILFLIKTRQKKKPPVLGQQFADAMVKEQQRLNKRPNLPSPMPKQKYERQKGQWGLLNPKPSELDLALRDLCVAFKEKPKQEQEELRSAISLDGFYTLIEFARRSSVFAMRDSDAKLLEDALVSIAMIEAKRTDFRDILMVLALLHHSAKRLGLDASQKFNQVAKLAEPETAELITGFAQRDSSSQSLRDSWGYFEVKTAYGTGLVRWGFEKYDPEYDLLGIAMEIALAIEEDSYFVDSIELATDLPPVWLETPQDTALPETLKRVTAGATVRCSLEDAKHPKAASQQFTLFMVELDSQESAQSLLELSSKKKAKDYSMLGFSNGKLFSLLIARSVVVGVESFETDESIKRFFESIDQAIKEVAP